MIHLPWSKLNLFPRHSSCETNFPTAPSLSRPTYAQVSPPLCGAQLISVLNFTNRSVVFNFVSFRSARLPVLSLLLSQSSAHSFPFFFFTSDFLLTIIAVSGFEDLKSLVAERSLTSPFFFSDWSTLPD